MNKFSRGQSCVECGSVCTTVSCHYSGKMSGSLGKGMGLKAKDIFCADLCFQCHAYYDAYHDGNSDERALKFMRNILLTIERRLSQGLLQWVNLPEEGI